MNSTHWYKQTAEAPLFGDLLWSRPETTATAGKLLIVGGNQYGFVEPANTYSAAGKAGVGVARMVLPDSVRRYVGKVFTAGELAPSTPSGSLSQQALGLLLQEANWSDGVLLAGGLGRNSETAILLEKFLTTYSGQVTLTKDAVDYFTTTVSPVLTRPETTLVLSFAQLQRLAISARFTTAFTFDMDFLRLIEALHDFSRQHTPYIVTKHLNTIFVAVNGEVSTTKLATDLPIWRVTTAAATSVWWLQNPSKPFEALTTAVYESTASSS